MQLTRHEAARSFLARSRAWLEEAEALNNLILGIATRLIEEPERIKAAPYLATVEADGQLLAAAVMTRPQRVVLYSTAGDDPAPLRPLVADLLAGDWQAPGVLGPAAVALAFAQLWAAATGQAYRLAMRERVYMLRQVIPPRPVAGHLRVATEADLPWVIDWVYRFIQDAGLPGTPEEAQELAGLRIGRRDIFVWEDAGRPVAMAAKARHTSHGITVALVYTPRELRGQGYASAVVAGLSQQLLDAGWQFCTLFTDLANPISNRIYQRLGYRPVADFDAYDFETRAGLDFVHFWSSGRKWGQRTKGAGLAPLPGPPPRRAGGG